MITETLIIKGIILVIIGSLIGWVTNYIAIKMLFRPYKEIKFLFFKIQGLIPKRKHEIGISLAETIETELISMKDILQKLNTTSMDEELGKIIDKMLDEKLERELTGKFPMLAMFLNESAMKKIKNSIKNSIMESKEDILETLGKVLEKNIDFKEIIIEKVDAFSLEDLEKIVFSLAKKELKHIELVGAILGAIIGLIQFLVTVLI